MTSPDESPRIGMHDVDPAALAAPGEPLAALLAARGASLASPPPDDAPEDGWRVVSERDEWMLAAAPAAGDGRTWWPVELRRGTDAWRASVSPEPLALRPSRAERRRGLELRWPAVVLDDPTAGDYSVDLVNTSDEVWRSEDELLQVIGVLTEPGATELGVGWFGGAGARGIALAPGDYIRLPVTIDDRAWERSGAGERDLHPVLVGVGLRAGPLRVHVTEERIAAARRRHRPSAADMRRRVEQSRTDLDVARAAGDALVELAALVSRQHDRDAALAAIAALLGVEADRAHTIFHTPLSQLSPAGIEEAEKRLAELERHLEES